jgi:hypothetical protein
MSGFYTDSHISDHSKKISDLEKLLIPDTTFPVSSLHFLRLKIQENKGSEKELKANNQLGLEAEMKELQSRIIISEQENRALHSFAGFYEMSYILSFKYTDTIHIYLFVNNILRRICSKF